MSCRVCGLDSPGTVGHELLAAEYDEHVDSGQVKHHRPVLQHPVAGVLMNELILEVKDERVVGCDFHVHCAARLMSYLDDITRLAAAAASGWLVTIPESKLHRIFMYARESLCALGESMGKFLISPSRLLPATRAHK